MEREIPRSFYRGSVGCVARERFVAGGTSVCAPDGQVFGNRVLL